MSILQLLLSLLMLVDQLEVEFSHFFLGHAKDTTCVVCYAPKLTRIEADGCDAASDLL